MEEVLNLAVLADPILWTIVAVCLIAIVLADRVCQWIIRRNSRWSGVQRRGARAAMLIFFIALVSTAGLYMATAVVFHS
ncbi:MAG: hypothetical protein RH942_02730 [Kiloniellaceae bacterium]